MARGGGGLQDAIRLTRGCEVKRRMVALIYRDFEDMVYMEGKKCERNFYFFSFGDYIFVSNLYLN